LDANKKVVPFSHGQLACEARPRGEYLLFEQHTNDNFAIFFKFNVQLALNNPNMRFSTSSVLLAASSLLGAALAHNIQLAAHGRECFHEMLHSDDKMTVTFQVGDREFGSAGNLDIDFWVRLSKRVYSFSG